MKTSLSNPISPLLRNKGSSILAEHGKRTPKQAQKQFREWASILPGRLLVMLAAYADESFAEDRPGRIPISAFGGFVASVEEWGQFNIQWQQILNDYKVRYFHFSEWAIARAVAIKKRRPKASFRRNAYCGWEEPKLNSFLLELAVLAHTRIQGSFGGYLSLKRFNERKVAGEIPFLEDHRDYCLKSCFEAFIDTLNAKWPHGSELVSFVWDLTQDESWKQSIIKAFEPFRKNNPSFASITFVNDQLCLPLQAADMIAYRIWQPKP